MPVDRNGVHYTSATLEEATHLVLTEEPKIGLLNRNYADICLKIVSKNADGNIRIPSVRKGYGYEEIDENGHFSYTFERYAKNKRIETLCILSSPEPPTVDDIKKHLQF